MKKNKHYRKGYRMERELVNMWRKAGYVAARTAGSHSPIDVLAVNPKTMDIILTQAKNSVLTENEVKRLGTAMGMKTKYKTTVRVFVAHKVEGETETKLTLI